MRRGLLVVGVVLTFFVPNAQASWREERAVAIARLVWHHPCVERMQLRSLTQAEFDELPRAKSPEEQQRAAVGLAAEPAMTADSDACIVYLPAGVRRGFPELCTQLLHEAGHLAGYRDPSNPADPEHSRDPNSVMYAIDENIYGAGRELDDYGGDPRCWHRGRPYLEAHGLLS